MNRAQRGISTRDNSNPHGRGVDAFVKEVVNLGAVLLLAGILALFVPVRKVQAASNPPAPTAAHSGSPAMAPPLADALGIHFVEGSTSTVLLERQGKRYLIDLGTRTIREQDAPAAAIAENSKGPAPPSASKDLEMGAKVFADKCSPCHGTDGKGNPAIGTPNFTSAKIQNSLSDEAIVKTIRDGKKGTPMPAWAGKLSDAEIQDVAAFVRSLGPARKPPEQPADRWRTKGPGFTLRRTTTSSACRRAGRPVGRSSRVHFQLHSSICV
jgi:mono/diheme cytochrome c family protein